MDLGSETNDAGAVPPPHVDAPDGESDVASDIASCVGIGKNTAALTEDTRSANDHHALATVAE